MSNSEIIKNDIFRYKFINQFIKGKILDHKSNNFTLYHSAKILLQNNVIEVYTLMELSYKKLNVRKLENDGSISFRNIDNNNLETSFDGVISFQNLNQENILEKLEFYYSILKTDGMLIFSVSNKREINSKTEQKINAFNLEELKNIIDSKFHIIEIYSQRFKEKPSINHKVVILRRIKSIMANVLNKIEIIHKVYQKNIKKTITKYDPYKQYFHKIPDEDFIPKIYKKKDNPLFLILICKKIT